MNKQLYRRSIVALINQGIQFGLPFKRFRITSRNTSFGIYYILTLSPTFQAKKVAQLHHLRSYLGNEPCPNNMNTSIEGTLSAIMNSWANK